MTYTVKNNTQPPIINRGEERQEKNCLRQYSVSLFDGTDEEKWKAYGVYVGSGSDSSFEDDYPGDLHDDEDEEKTVNSTQPLNGEITFTEEK